MRSRYKLLPWERQRRLLPIIEGTLLRVLIADMTIGEAARAYRYGGLVVSIL
ncbi:hypothetical protein M3J09_010343 [Ascochyta lentis]